MPDDKVKVTDPVCGMEFGVEKAVGQTMYKGMTYYFCTDACRKQFAAEPDRYARPATAES